LLFDRGLLTRTTLSVKILTMIDTDILDSWLLHLAAERKSAQTLKSYGDGVRRFLDYCAAQGCDPVLDRPTVEAFQRHLLAAGQAPSTVVSRQMALRRLSMWLAEEGEIDTDALVGLKRPKIDQKVIQPLSTEQVKALIAACAGKGLPERRDAAIVRLMAESGLRASEVIDLRRTDVDLKRRIATVHRGKGGKGRVVPMSAATASAIDRYLRARSAHRLADAPALWLGDRGKAFTYDALHKTIAKRGAAAGIDHLHPHLLRHTAAHHWLAKGGTEQSLMAVAGWSRPDMLMRYTRAQASERAMAEFADLGMGEW
jgi:site-specific recombinase XerD